MINKIYYMYENFYEKINEFSIEAKNIIDAYGGFNDNS